MKKILLPTDFSKNAWNAIDYALQFFENEACLFYVLNTYTPSFYRVDYMVGGPVHSAIPDVGVDLSLGGLEHTLLRIEKKYKNPKHQFETLSAFNTPTDEIKEVCETKDIDMVVMGTQGASGAKELFLGSNTVHVIRKSKRPVLAVPVEYDFRKITQVLLPTDYASKYNLNELEPLLEIVSKNKALLHVVHAVEEDDLTPIQLENQEHLKVLLKGLSVVFQDITDAYMPNVVHSYVEKNDMDLIVMMNKKHSFLERLLLKQNVDSIGYSSTVPFLVLHDTSEIIK
ncbi:universal stress protein [Allomuricauda sp. R78024]|uniref:universal stress protein n=1 Tax=Allomuricauda sp. R78024 TaxID=3093867 RepID=UPI0037C8B4F6